MSSKSLKRIKRRHEELEAKDIDQFWPNSINSPWVPPVAPSASGWLFHLKKLLSTTFHRACGSLTLHATSVK